MRVFYSVGEPSGDEHAAGVIAELKRRHPHVICEGFGGPQMEQAGCSLMFRLTDLAVMGFFKVLPLVFQCRRLIRQAAAHFAEHKPDAVVLVDYPGFNWWVARAAKRQGIPVYYYLPPQLWAWAPWRIGKVRRLINHVICALPFEFEWFQRRGVPATWVGHPFFDEVAEKKLDESVQRALTAAREAAVRESSETTRPMLIGLLPGSRDHEIDRNWPVIVDVVRKIEQAVPGTRWAIGSFKEEHTRICREQLKGVVDSERVQFVTGHASEVIETADCCVMVSGSISLEVLARATPTVVLFRLSRFAKFMSSIFINCDYITLTNLIAEKPLMPEYLSSGPSDAVVQSISSHLLEWHDDREKLVSRRDEMRALADRVAVRGATGRVVDFLCEQMSLESSSDSSQSMPRSTNRAA